MIDAKKSSIGELTWDVVNSDESNFLRTSIILSGRNNCILIDGGLTFSNGRLLANRIRQSGKHLQAILITCSDPDYYFGLAPIHAAFPDVPVVAMPAIVAAIEASVDHKIAIWTDRLGPDSPSSMASIVMPQPLTGDTLTIEDNEIRLLPNFDPGRAYFVWVPSIRAIFGGILVISGVHNWMADFRTRAERAAVLASLDEMSALDPQVVIPTHMVAGCPIGPATINFTRDYNLAFEAALQQATNSNDVIVKMTKAYPTVAFPFSLEFGAKVCMGEVQWP